MPSRFPNNALWNAWERPTTTTTSSSTTTPPLTPYRPVVQAAMSCGVDGTISGDIDFYSDQCCGGWFSGKPLGTNNWGRQASYRIGTNPGDTLTGTISVSITQADLSGPCGGIDPIAFPECAYVAVGLETGLVIAFVIIPTVVGMYVYNYSINGATYVGSVT